MCVGWNVVVVAVFFLNTNMLQPGAGDLFLKMKEIPFIIVFIHVKEVGGTWYCGSLLPLFCEIL